GWAKGCKGQAWRLPDRWLALYVYEYLLHVGAQKSAQTFLSEVSHLLGTVLRQL
uniref:Uncharacterized protein n=1 Tax=Ursus americanus TaxID=9643 RepID=A0A452QCB0_URSAM